MVDPRPADERSDSCGTTNSPAAYAHALDAIVLSGTHQNPRRLINGRNKAFLSIEGRTLVRHVTDALLAADNIDKVFVVGPVAELAEVMPSNPRVHLVEQEGRFLSNGWAGIRASEARHDQLPVHEIHERPMLIISCDLPLISPGAIDDFIERCARCDKEDGITSAMLVGLAEESGLRPFYGDAERPGVVRPLVQMHEGLVRLSNIYVARPRKLGHSEILQASFSHRKAEDWRNVIKLAADVLGQQGGWSAAWIIVRLQVTAMLARGKGKLYQKLRRGNTMVRVERGISSVLAGPVKTVITPYGGLSLDVDDKEDFRMLSERYPEWMEVVAQLDLKRSSSQQDEGQPGPESNDGDSQHEPEEKR